MSNARLPTVLDVRDSWLAAAAAAATAAANVGLVGSAMRAGTKTGADALKEEKVLRLLWDDTALAPTSKSPKGGVTSCSCDCSG